MAITSITDASKTLVPLAGPVAGLLFAVALIFSGIGSSITSSMAEVNVITGFLGKPEDPRTLLYRVATFITAIPSFVIILMGLDTYKILIFSQVIPLLYLCRKKPVMGTFRSSSLEFLAMLLITVVVTLLNVYLLYSTFAGGA
jgi:manganese transport protein